MFHVKKMDPADFPFAVELANTMNWNMADEDFKFNTTLEPNGCLVLQDNSENVGVATCISYGQVGWFGNLVVKEEYRRKGAGTTLVNHAINYLRSSGASTIGLYAYQHLEDFYKRLGFMHDIDFVVLKANAVSPTSVRDAHLKTAELRELPKVVNIDCKYFGASRKKLIKQILQNPLNLSYIAVEGAELVGYGTAKVYSKTAEIGPFVCQRNHAETALALLKAVLKRLENVEAYMYLPSSETELINEAYEMGFKEEFQLSRMFLGPGILQDGSYMYIAESLERG